MENRLWASSVFVPLILANYINGIRKALLSNLPKRAGLAVTRTTTVEAMGMVNEFPTWGS
jgi:hypothetical protein